MTPPLQRGVIAEPREKSFVFVLTVACGRSEVHSSETPKKGLFSFCSPYHEVSEQSFLWFSEVVSIGAAVLGAAFASREHVFTRESTRCFSVRKHTRTLTCMHTHAQVTFYFHHFLCLDQTK